MIIEDLVVQLWPALAFIVTIVIALISDKRHAKSTERRIEFLEKTILGRIKHTEKAEEETRRVLYDRMKRDWETQHPEKPVKEETKKVLESASASATAAILYDWINFVKFSNDIKFPHPFRFKKSADDENQSNSEAEKE